MYCRKKSKNVHSFFFFFFYKQWIFWTWSKDVYFSKLITDESCSMVPTPGYFPYRLWSFRNDTIYLKLIYYIHKLLYM